MRKKNYPSQRQEQGLLVGKEVSLNNSHQMAVGKPLPQMQSYHIANQPTYLRTEHAPLTSHHSAARIRSPRVRQHAQFLTQESIPVLQERLKSIQEYYQLMAAEQRSRNSQRSEVIMQVIEEMQAAHQQKVEAIRKLIQESEQQKRDVGFVDDKMNEIKGNIEDLIEESNTLKIKNQQLERRIERKRKDLGEKQYQLQELNKELLQARGELESFEINNLKNNKINRQIQELFNSASNLTSDE